MHASEYSEHVGAVLAACRMQHAMYVMSRICLAAEQRRAGKCKMPVTESWMSVGLDLDGKITCAWRLRFSCRHQMYICRGPA